MHSSIYTVFNISKRDFPIFVICVVADLITYTQFTHVTIIIISIGGVDLTIIFSNLMISSVAISFDPMIDSLIISRAKKIYIYIFYIH